MSRFETKIEILRSINKFFFSFFRKLLGYESLEEMYTKMSCIHYWHGIDKPMVFINAIDDPIVPPQLLERVKDATSTFVLSIGTTLKR
jgi:abhydrolase domain-containing protein 2